MNTENAADNPLAAYAHVERSISAMRIRINYRARRTHLVSGYVGDECAFFTPLSEFDEAAEEARRRNAAGFIDSHLATETASLDAYVSLDPYAVRRDFENVRSETDALKLLNSSGTFWPISNAFTWRQFQEWQQFVHLVRQTNFPALAEDDIRAANAMYALNGYPDRFFTAPDIPESEFEKRYWARAIEIDPQAASMRSLVEAQRRKQLHRLCTWFDQPPEEAIKIKLNDQSRSVDAAEHLQAFSPMVEKHPRTHTMTIQARNILEAIAATIFADRSHGVRCEKCCHCKRLFEKETDRETKYCGKACKNAATQKVWRAAKKGSRQKS